MFVERYRQELDARGSQRLHRIRASPRAVMKIVGCLLALSRACRARPDIPGMVMFAMRQAASW